MVESVGELVLLREDSKIFNPKEQTVEDFLALPGTTTPTFRIYTPTAYALNLAAYKTNRVTNPIAYPEPMLVLEFADRTAEQAYDQIKRNVSAAGIKIASRWYLKMDLEEDTTVALCRFDPRYCEGPELEVLKEFLRDTYAGKYAPPLAMPLFMHDKPAMTPEGN